MPKEHLVSVILPTYNRARLLPRAIESVITQTSSEWELLIWDDGSTDETELTVNSYQDDRIRYFFEPNHGKSYSLIQAIEHSKGSYLAFLDDDDQWLPEKLKIQTDLFNQNPAIDLVFGNFRNINLIDNSQAMSFSQNKKGFSLLSVDKINQYDYLVVDGWLRSIAKSNYIAFDTVMITKNLYDEIGPFNEQLKNGMDFEYWWRFGLMNKKAAFTSKVVMDRFKYPNSLSANNLRSIDNHLKMLDACADLSNKHQIFETVAYLRPMYRNAWQNKIVAYGLAGDKKNAWHSFLRSLDYGFCIGSAKLLFIALL